MTELRSSMSKTLNKTYKKGDKTLCIKDKSTLNMSADTEPYCKEAYKEVPQDFEECNFIYFRY